MNGKVQNSLGGSGETTCENKRKKTYEQLFFEYLTNKVETATMVSDATGIPQKSITRYKRNYEKIGKLAEVYHFKCKSSGYKAWYITTDLSQFPTNPQLNLFEP